MLGKENVKLCEKECEEAIKKKRECKYRFYQRTDCRINDLRFLTQFVSEIDLYLSSSITAARAHYPPQPPILRLDKLLSHSSDVTRQE